MSEDRDCTFAEYFSTNPLSSNWFDIVDPSSILSLPVINLQSPTTTLTDRHAIKAALHASTISEVAIYRKTEGIPADSHLENPEDGHRMPFIDDKIAHYLSACQLGNFCDWKIPPCVSANNFGIMRPSTRQVMPKRSVASSERTRPLQYLWRRRETNNRLH